MRKPYLVHEPKLPNILVNDNNKKMASIQASSFKIVHKKMNLKTLKLFNIGRKKKGRYWEVHLFPPKWNYMARLHSIMPTYILRKKTN